MSNKSILVHYKRLRNNWIFIVAEYAGGVFNSHIMDIAKQNTPVYTSETNDMKIFEQLKSDEAIQRFIDEEAGKGGSGC
jgi:hypothetical protein